MNGWEGIFQVSNTGKVRRLYKKGSKELKGVVKQGGYKGVLLKVNGIFECKLIHRLVAEAFISNPKNLPHVNHKDEDKTNNCVSNLEWCDAKYNNNYGTKGKRISKSKLNKTYNCYQVKCIETRNNLS